MRFPLLYVFLLLFIIHLMQFLLEKLACLNCRSSINYRIFWKPIFPKFLLRWLWSFLQFIVWKDGKSLSFILLYLQWRFWFGLGSKTWVTPVVQVGILSRWILFSLRKCRTWLLLPATADFCFSFFLNNLQVIYWCQCVIYLSYEWLLFYIIYL